MLTTSDPISTSEALRAARETRSLQIGQQILAEVPKTFQRYFQDQTAVVVADTRTYAAAGRAVMTALQSQGCAALDPFIFEDDDLYAEHRFVERLEQSLRSHSAYPIAVGSGTINDLVKLATHRVGRQYVCVATAASMDGYTAYGASITFEGSKQTFDCPAPIAVIADLDVIAHAPQEMVSWGYADLLAKVTAGADWILADFLDVEPIQPHAWNIVQSGLKLAVGQPELIRAGDRTELARLVEGLMLGGFAMQSMRSSRPASGAEHQFSHLWDMQHHTHNGLAPSHGAKVGIGTLAVTSLYERLFATATAPFQVDQAVNQWPGDEQWNTLALRLFDDPILQQLAVRELAEKRIDKESLRTQLQNVHHHWAELRARLQQQLIPLEKLRSMLRAIGAPTASEEIGISAERLQRSFLQAQMIRRRFTILDLAARIGQLQTPSQ